MKKMLCILLLFPIALWAQETVIKTTPGSDITSLLQDAVNTSQKVIIDGEYVISNTIVIQDNVSVSGINNAVIGCSSSAKGNLAALMRFFLLSGQNNHVSKLTFKGDQFPNLAKYALSAIYITGERNVVEDAVFSFNFGYGKDVYGIWISGPNANYNTVKHNRLYTVGIQYAENSASYNICQANYIYRAGTDGLQGTGNNADHIPCKKNQVLNNVVELSGYSGIEDQQYIDGTLIAHNVVNRSGNAKYHVNSMGISAVGTNTIVTDNTVNGFGIYGIEVAGGAGLKIENNTVTDNAGTASLLMVNLLTPARPDYIGSTTLLNNKLYGGNMGIDLEGNYNVKIKVEGNFIKNFNWKGISVETTARDAFVEITNNTILVTKPNIKSRSAIFSYASKPTNCQIKIEKNTIKYLPSIKGGLGSENGILLGHSGISIKNNTVITGGATVITYTTNGASLSGINSLNNKAVGGKIDLPGLKNGVQAIKN